MDDQRKDYVDPKRPSQRNCSKQLRTHNGLHYNVINTNCTNKRRDLLLAYKLWIVPEEQKGCHKGSRDTGGLLYIDLHIFIKNKRRKNLPMAWIDYKKAYDMVSQSWIINCLKMYKISDEVINYIEKTMNNWRMKLIAEGKSLAKAKIQRSTFKIRCHHYYL